MDERRVPADVAAALAVGRAHYLDGAYVAAEADDERALELALALGSAEGAVRCLRYLGLCAYRIGNSIRSADLLERARLRAREIGWLSEELLCCNHLGA